MNFKPSIPVYIQIKNDIANKIRSGLWEENQKIPSEAKLMETYNVGRGTIREAIKQVVEEGYVYIKKGVGTFVSQHEVGISLEPFVSLTYFIKMRGLSIKTKVLDKQEMIVDESINEVTGLKKGTNCLFVKRLRILEGKPLAIEEFYFSSIGQVAFDDYDFTKPISQYMFDKKHIKVSKMNMDFNILESTEEIKSILELSKNSKMIKSSRKVLVEPDDEIYYYLTFYCGENLKHIGTDSFI